MSVAEVSNFLLRARLETEELFCAMMSKLVLGFFVSMDCLPCIKGSWMHLRAGAGLVNCYSLSVMTRPCIPHGLPTQEGLKTQDTLLSTRGKEHVRAQTVSNQNARL
eukprot:1060830-Pelagomonas_calceolata.AAC.3